jgi:AraC-like DNA-binding protein
VPPAHRRAPAAGRACAKITARMAYREFPPHPVLRPYVDRLWTSTPDARVAPGPRRILPDGCIDLLVNLDRGHAFVVGAMTGPWLVPPGPSSSIVAVRFRPGGGAPLLALAAHELTDRRVDSTDLPLGWLAPERLAEASDVEVAVRALERVLVARVLAVAAPDPLVAHAVDRLLALSPPSVEALARRIGWSRQHLGRAFSAHVGLGPKQLGRIARLQRALVALQARSGSVAATAASLGYFDQAHMARDFRALAGVTPLAAQDARGSIFPIHSLLEAA